MDGVLILDKPAGMTSHDVVAAVRRLTGQRKIGHTGTLDPMATGVLVLCLGEATKILQYLPETSKTYTVEACLGIETDTQDQTGLVLAENRNFTLSHEELAKVLDTFRGPGMQIPPMYSAVQIGGERLYRLARAGREIERPARRIAIDALRLDWPRAEESPVFRYGDRIGFTVTGGKGLYVRTLCHDLGRKLGCGAHMFALRRTASGPFLLADAVPLAELTGEEAAHRLQSMGRALAHLPVVNLDRWMRERVLHGNAVAADTMGDALARAVDEEGATIAILGRRGDLWQPLRVLRTGKQESGGAS